MSRIAVRSAQAAPTNASKTPQSSLLSRRANGQDRAASVPPIVHEVLNSPGQPLDAATRAYMEPRFGHDFSKVRVHADAKAVELSISEPGDPFEQEADRIADQVMRIPRMVAPAKIESEPVLRRHTIRQAASDIAHTAPPIVRDSLRSSGQPLDAETRAFMEPRFGQDFSQVRVHADARAAGAASAVGARAFTLNRDIVFGRGEYMPQTESGRRLLSHELTHVVQQRPTVQRKETAEARESSISASTPALEHQTQEDDCRLELAVGKVIYCFVLIPIADKPGRWRVTATTSNKNLGGKTPIEYTGDIKIKIINGKHRIEPVGVFKMCSLDPTSRESCIWVDDVNFTRMLDLETPPK